jgi:phage I-like protein
MRQTNEIAICGADGAFGLAVCAGAAADETALFGLQLNPDLPEWVHLAPLGAIPARDGRSFKLSDARAVIAATRDLKMDLPIDYDHATDLAPAGTGVPAAGWIKGFEVREDGIWGRVDWTEKGAAAVRGGEYRYLSPVFHFDKKSKEVIRLVRAALTNNPALYLKAVASNQGAEMNELLKKLAALLGLPEDSDEKAVCAAIEALNGEGKAIASIARAAGLDDKAKPADIEAAIAKAVASAGKASGEVLTGIASALGLEKDASAADIETAAAKATAAAAKAGDRDELATRLARLEEGSATEKAEASVKAAIEEGKIVPAQRDWAIGLAKKDPKGFEDFLAGQPVIVKPGQDAGGNRPRTGGGVMDDEDIAVAKAMGLTADAYKKTLEEEVDN